MADKESSPQTINEKIDVLKSPSPKQRVISRIRSLESSLFKEKILFRFGDAKKLKRMRELKKELSSLKNLLRSLLK